MVIDSNWKRRTDFSLYRSVEDVLNTMDTEMTILNPVHLWRITLLKTTCKKGEKCSELLVRLTDGAKVSNLRQLTQRDCFSTSSWTSVLRERTPKILRMESLMCCEKIKR